MSGPPWSGVAMEEQQLSPMVPNISPETMLNLMHVRQGIDECAAICALVTAPPRDETDHLQVRVQINSIKQISLLLWFEPLPHQIQFVSPLGNEIPWVGVLGNYI